MKKTDKGLTATELDRVKFFLEFRTKTLAQNPAAIRWCMTERTAKYFSKLDAVECIRCENHVLNDGICDPL